MADRWWTEFQCLVQRQWSPLHQTLNCLGSSIAILTNLLRYLKLNHKMNGNSSKTFRISSALIDQHISRKIKCFSRNRNWRLETLQSMSSLSTAQYSGNWSNSSCGWSWRNFKLLILEQQARLPSDEERTRILSHRPVDSFSSYRRFQRSGDWLPDHLGHSEAREIGFQIITAVSLFLFEEMLDKIVRRNVR